MHRPHTTGESSPGPGAPGALPSSAMWQMPHRSSSVVHVHEATPCQFLMLILKPPSVLPALALVNAPLIVTANLAQILQNRRNRSTGELSALTVLLRWLGAVVRVGTTLWQLKGDRAVLLNHTLGVLCTSTLLAQLWWYGRTETR